MADSRSPSFDIDHFLLDAGAVSGSPFASILPSTIATPRSSTAAFSTSTDGPPMPAFTFPGADALPGPSSSSLPRFVVEGHSNALSSCSPPLSMQATTNHPTQDETSPVAYLSFPGIASSAGVDVRPRAASAHIHDIDPGRTSTLSSPDATSTMLQTPSTRNTSSHISLCEKHDQHQQQIVSQNPTQSYFSTDLMLPQSWLVAPLHQPDALSIYFPTLEQRQQVSGTFNSEPQNADTSSGTFLLKQCNRSSSCLHLLRLIPGYVECRPWLLDRHMVKIQLMTPYEVQSYPLRPWTLVSGYIILCRIVSRMPCTQPAVNNATRQSS